MAAQREVMSLLHDIARNRRDVAKGRLLFQQDEEERVTTLAKQRAEDAVLFRSAVEFTEEWRNVTGLQLKPAPSLAGMLVANISNNTKEGNLPEMEYRSPNNRTPYQFFRSLLQSTHLLESLLADINESNPDIRSKGSLVLEQCLFTYVDAMVRKVSLFSEDTADEHYFSPNYSRSPATTNQETMHLFSKTVSCQFGSLLSETNKHLRGLVRTSGLCRIDELMLDCKGNEKEHFNGDSVKLVCIEALGPAGYPEPIAYFIERTEGGQFPGNSLHWATPDLVSTMLFPGCCPITIADSPDFKSHLDRMRVDPTYFSFGIHEQELPPRTIDLLVKDLKRGSYRMFEDDRGWLWTFFRPLQGNLVKNCSNIWQLGQASRSKKLSLPLPHNPPPFPLPDPPLPASGHDPAAEVVPLPTLLKNKAKMLRSMAKAAGIDTPEDDLAASLSAVNGNTYAENQKAIGNYYRKEAAKELKAQQKAQQKGGKETETGVKRWSPDTDEYSPSAKRMTVPWPWLEDSGLTERQRELTEASNPNVEAQTFEARKVIRTHSQHFEAESLTGFLDEIHFPFRFERREPLIVLRLVQLHMLHALLQNQNRVLDDQPQSGEELTLLMLLHHLRDDWEKDLLARIEKEQ